MRHELLTPGALGVDAKKGTLSQHFVAPPLGGTSGHLK